MTSCEKEELIQNEVNQNNFNFEKISPLTSSTKKIGLKEFKAILNADTIKARQNSVELLPLGGDRF